VKQDGVTTVTPFDAPRDELLARGAGIIAEAWASFDSAREDQPPLSRRVRSILGEPLPDAPSAVETALADAALVLDESLAQPRPRFFAFVGSAGLPAGVVADALASCFDANLAVDAGAATAVENQAISWMGALLGYPAEAGAFTSGGTVSNLTALAAARERALPGMRQTGSAGCRHAVYCSEAAHQSVVRAAEILGIGRSNVRRIAIDANRRLILGALAYALDEDTRRGVVPLAVVATAGSTLTGAIDPINQIAQLCDERDVWLHIDGAYGLPAAALPEMRMHFAGLERADSVSVDAHKWLYLPKACGVVLVRRRIDLQAAFGHEEDYLPHEEGEPHAVDITLEYSRPFRALKFWLAVRLHGAEAFRSALRENLRQAQLLYQLTVHHPDLEPLSRPELTVVPFRHAPAGVRDLNDHNARLAAELQRDARVWLAPALIDGQVWLRPCIVNFRTSDEDIHALVQVVCEVGAQTGHQA
jgi:aromatic-L-amino-acid decarboxylase